MQIAICDDSEKDREKIKEICEQVIQNNEMKCEIICCSDGADILKFKRKPDLLILDIEMPMVNGIEVKNQLQLYNEQTYIIYVSSHDEMSLEAFGLHVYGFIVKDKVDVQLPVMLTSVLEVIQCFVMLEDRINSKSIIYIQAESVYCRIYLVNGTSELIRSSMKELEQKLIKACFIRVHRSFIINPKWVSKIDDGEVILKGAKKPVPISKRMHAKVKKQYRAYCEKNARYC